MKQPSNYVIFEAMGVVLPSFLGLMVAAMVSTAKISPALSSLSWLISAGISIWMGYRIRSAMQREVNGPLEWVTLRMPLQITALFVRWPMLLFDLWTVGIASLFFMLTF